MQVGIALAVLCSEVESSDRLRDHCGSSSDAPKGQAPSGSHSGSFRLALGLIMGCTPVIEAIAHLKAMQIVS